MLSGLGLGSQSGFTSLDQSRGEIDSVFFLERSDMDQWVVTVDQFTTAMASIQEASASPRQEIDSQQSRQFVVQDETPCDSLPHLPPPLGSTVPRAPPYMLHGHFEVASPAYTRASPLAKFRMPDIERYMVVGCLYTYLRLYSTVMRAHGLDSHDDHYVSFISRSSHQPERTLFHRGVDPEGVAWLMDLDGNRFSEPTNVDQLKRYYSITTFLHIFIVSLSFLSLLVIHLIHLMSYSLLTATHLGLTMIDLVSPGFWAHRTSGATLRHIPFHLEVYGSSQICTSALLDAWMPSCLSIWEDILDICA
ncbi:hypothetical protein AAG906_019620 [Vitis piasezkii]